MRRLLLTMLAVLAVAPALALAATKPVDITRAGFSPNKLTIDPGDTVTWTSKDTTPHQVVADQGKFPASLVLQSGQSYSYTFTRSGSYGYRDAFATNKRGTVTVRVGVSMTASKMTMTYGATTTLSGSVSDGSSGETVTIDAQECGKTGFTKIATVKTGTPPTMVTSARFRARLRRGTLLRLFLPQSQAGACYATTRSGTRKA